MAIIAALGVAAFTSAVDSLEDFLDGPSSVQRLERLSSRLRDHEDEYYDVRYARNTGLWDAQARRREAEYEQRRDELWDRIRREQEIQARGRIRVPSLGDVAGQLPFPLVRAARDALNPSESLHPGSHVDAMGPRV